MHRQSFWARTRQRLFGAKLLTCDDHEPVDSFLPTETSPLLKSNIRPTSDDVASDPIEEPVEQTRDARVAWPYEAKIIASYSIPLTVTFLLQYSVDASSLIAAGRLGKLELGAVSCQYDCFYTLISFLVC